ncbi:MAG: hypothetical protein C3F18_03945 [Nitrosomonadales bacterium]|nr:MAG: hypothetical protein C3F18_03945 [Nitrosomonadales bacterium]
MNKLATLVFCMVIGFSFMAPSYAVSDKSPQLAMSSAINKAGRQRMLSQRIVKFYCQAGQQILVDKSKKQLLESIDLFEAQLLELKQVAPNQEVQVAVAKMEALWGPFKEIAAATPTKEGGKKLIGMSEELLQATHKTTMLLQDAAGTQAGRLVNIAGRQRMLSQRMAQFYMLKRFGFNTSEVNDGLEQARNEFKGALQELLASPQNTPAIRKELELAKMQWIFFENALARDSAYDVTFAVNAATSSERILEVMDRVTGMYEKL